MANLQDIFHRVLKIQHDEYRDELGPEDVDGWDSLGHLHLVSALEEEYGIEFDMRQIESMQTVGKIKDVLKQVGVIHF